MRTLLREHPVYDAVLLFLLSVLVYGAFHEMTAQARAVHAASSVTPASVRAQAAAQGQLGLHVADADADLGPGEAEPMLVQHPGR